MQTLEILLLSEHVDLNVDVDLDLDVDLNVELDVDLKVDLTVILCIDFLKEKFTKFNSNLIIKNILTSKIPIPNS